MTSCSEKLAVCLGFPWLGAACSVKVSKISNVWLTPAAGQSLVQVAATAAADACLWQPSP